LVPGNQFLEKFCVCLRVKPEESGKAGELEAGFIEQGE